MQTLLIDSVLMMELLGWPGMLRDKITAEPLETTVWRSMLISGHNYLLFPPAHLQGNIGVGCLEAVQGNQGIHSKQLLTLRSTMAGPWYWRN